MEAPEEVGIGNGSKEQTINKGKRTKRLRPQSPSPLPLSIYTGGEGVDPYTKVSTPLSSSSEYVSTEEEEDMANCLILLSQSRGFIDEQGVDTREKGVDTSGGIYYKFNSRRFVEAPSTGGGKAGYYVYECKTCNRTFPSFQALGGHRASHKKPKTAVVEEKRHFSDEEEGQFSQFPQFFNKNNNLMISSNLSLQLSNNRGNLYKGKVHECSICGAEFNSGQALGGHMRRHRGPVGNGNTNTALSLTPIAVAVGAEQPKKQNNNVLSLDLDLNLPAPEDDHHHRESKFSFASKQQLQQPKPPPQRQPQQQQQQQQQKAPPQAQPPLVFSASALVGCHY